jgi:hypothetical protein
MGLDSDRNISDARALMPIPLVVDAQGEPDPLDLPWLHAGATEILQEAASIHGPFIGRLDRISRNWLVRSGSPHLYELDAIASRVQHPGVYLLNLSYEWSCTISIIADAHGGVRMLRAFDGGLKALAGTIIAFRRLRGRYPYLSLSWPMFVGEATIVAPGRFAIAMNQAPLRHYSACWVCRSRKPLRSGLSAWLSTRGATCHRPICCGRLRKRHHRLPRRSIGFFARLPASRRSFVLPGRASPRAPSLKRTSMKPGSIRHRRQRPITGAMRHRASIRSAACSAPRRWPA